jgi:hypothetical protein
MRIWDLTQRMQMISLAQAKLARPHEMFVLAAMLQVF